MSRPFSHPNDPGKWTVLETAAAATLWRRDRVDPVPVTLFYIIAPPCQPHVSYVEAEARARFARDYAPQAA